MILFFIVIGIGYQSHYSSYFQPQPTNNFLSGDIKIILWLRNLSNQLNYCYNFIMKIKLIGKDNLIVKKKYVDGRNNNRLTLDLVMKIVFLLRISLDQSWNQKKLEKTFVKSWNFKIRGIYEWKWIMIKRKLTKKVLQI